MAQSINTCGLLCIAFSSAESLVLLVLLALPLWFFLKGRRKSGAVAVFVTTIPTVLLLIVISIPDGAVARDKATRMFCLQNQQLMEDAIKSIGKARAAKPEDSVTMAEVSEVLKTKGMPVCPGGGQYAIRNYGQHSFCSLENHSR